MAIALLHTFSLADIAEGWDSQCKFVYRGVKYAELKALQASDPTKVSETEAVDGVIQFITDHFVSGCGLNEKSEHVELLATDVADLPIETLTKIFTEMNGGNLDPKDTQPEAPNETQPESLETPTTTL
jgi:hypothetical protein